jgi:hypothetical protein
VPERHSQRPVIQPEAQRGAERALEIRVLDYGRPGAFTADVVG